MQALLASLSGIVMRLLPLLLMAFVAGSTFWLVQINSPKEDQAAQTTKKHEPDYFMDRFSATELAPDGSTKSALPASAWSISRMTRPTR